MESVKPQQLATFTINNTLPSNLFKYTFPFLFPCVGDSTENSCTDVRFFCSMVRCTFLYLLFYFNSIRATNIDMYIYRESINAFFHTNYFVEIKCIIFIWRHVINRASSSGFVIRFPPGNRRFIINLVTVVIAQLRMLMLPDKRMALSWDFFFFTRCVFADIIRLNNLIFQVIYPFRHLNSNIISFSFRYFSLKILLKSVMSFLEFGCRYFFNLKKKSLAIITSIRSNYEGDHSKTTPRSSLD